MNLLGVDVGFSRNRRSTGLAWRIDGRIGTALTGSSWVERSAALPSTEFLIAGLDAPLLPSNEGWPHRGCEGAFYGGAFWNRCRPGLSHYGRSALLRNAGAEAASQFEAVVSSDRLASGVTVWGRSSLIEAFPNTFMGVLLPDSVYVKNERRKGEAKSDWLYRKIVEQGILFELLTLLGWTESPTTDLFQRQAGPDGHHDIRAALVCLLTAGFAAQGQAAVIGGPEHGWFWLPPLSIWEKWAKEALETQIRKLRPARFPSLIQWPSSVLR